MEGYAILNEKVCDKYWNCDAMRNCKHGAISLVGGKHSPDRKISIDKTKCAACGQCIEYCGLFRVVKHKMNEADIRRNEFDPDPRDNSDYQSTERFGCDVFNKPANRLQSVSAVESYISASADDRYDILEFADDVNLLCPFQGIAVPDIQLAFSPLLRLYKKYVVKPENANDIYSRYHLDDLPAILLLNQGKVYQVIYGRYRVNNITEEQKRFEELKMAFAEALPEMLPETPADIALSRGVTV